MSQLTLGKFYNFQVMKRMVDTQTSITRVSFLLFFQCFQCSRGNKRNLFKIPQNACHKMRLFYCYFVLIEAWVSFHWENPISKLPLLCLYQSKNVTGLLLIQLLMNWDGLFNLNLNLSNFFSRKYVAVILFQGWWLTKIIVYSLLVSDFPCTFWKLHINQSI